jgi:hypothetical protein
LAIVNQLWRTLIQKELGKNIKQKKSYGKKCLFQAFLHVKKFNVVNPPKRQENQNKMNDSNCAPLAEQLAGRAVYGAPLFRNHPKI